MNKKLPCICGANNWTEYNRCVECSEYYDRAEEFTKLPKYCDCGNEVSDDELDMCGGVCRDCK